MAENFEFEHNGEKFWYSRSVTAVVYVFAYSRKRKEWFVLADKRGPGCPSCNGQWNVPCGYLDHNESILGFVDRFVEGNYVEGAALRELREETGLRLHPNDLRFYKFFTTPFGKKQNVNCVFYSILQKDVDEYRNVLTDEYSEPGEVDEIKWISIEELNNYDFAFNQKPIILSIFKKYVDVSLWIRMMLKLRDFLNKKYGNSLVE